MRKKLGRKACSKCKMILPVAAFGVRSKNLDGLMSECRRCAKRARWRRYDAQKHGVTVETFTQSELLDFWVSNGIDPNHCIYCDGPYEHDDHVVPLSRGGPHERANLAPSCAQCNWSKGAKLLEEWQPA